MGQIEDMYKSWINEVESDPQDITTDIFIDEWTPKVKWFRPPLWKIFRWAYKHRYLKLCNCYPVSINTSSNITETVDDIEFVAVNYNNPAIDKMAKELIDNINGGEMDK